MAVVLVMSNMSQRATVEKKKDILPGIKLSQIHLKNISKMLL